MPAFHPLQTFGREGRTLVTGAHCEHHPGAALRSPPDTSLYETIVLLVSRIMGGFGIRVFNDNADPTSRDIGA
jgi:hypothetical protein